MKGETRIVADASCTVYNTLVKSFLAPSDIRYDLIGAVRVSKIGTTNIANIHPGQLFAPARMNGRHEFNADDDHSILARSLQHTTNMITNPVEEKMTISGLVSTIT